MRKLNKSRERSDTSKNMSALKANLNESVHENLYKYHIKS